MSIQPTTLLVSILLGVTLSACSSGPIKRTVPPRFTVEELPTVLLVSETEILNNGDLNQVLEDLRSARLTPGMSNAQAQEVQNALEKAANAVIVQSDDPELLKDILYTDIPRRLAVEAGMRAATLFFEEGERVKAYRTIKMVDSTFPNHHERLAAGNLLAQIGLNLAEDPGSYLYIFKYRYEDAPEVLEYFVINYPSNPLGAPALFTLAEIYQEERDLNLAIQKHHDLLLWFPESPYAIQSQALVPRLRLMQSLSPEYDRDSLLKAKRELEQWLSEHQNPELADQVRYDLVDVRRRLADSSLTVARFYRTLGQTEGTLLHARRALEEARLGGDADQIEEAQELLADLVPPAEGKTP